MSKRPLLLRISLVMVVVLLGVWFVVKPSSPQPDSATHQQALRQSLAPYGAASNAAEQSDFAYEAITPVVVNMADIPANEYDPNNMYDRWLRGEIDLDENEGRISEAELAALQDAALKLKPDSAVQQPASGPGLKAPVPGIGFASLDTSQCCGGGGSVPPDPEMAAGPNHLIAVVNVAFAIYDKSGTMLSGPTTFSSFFAAQPSCVSQFDPNVVYDEEADRWVIGVDGNGTHYCIAVSQTSNPLGSWNMYTISTQPLGGEFHDYPHAGVGDSYIVMGANQFGGNIPGGFEGRVWAFDKSVMYAGGALVPMTASTGNDGSPQPLNLHGFQQSTWPAYGGTHYFATDPYDGCTVHIWKWDVPTAPTIVSTVNLCTATGVAGGMPVNFPQMGGNNLQANDFRLRDFEYRNGSAWIADSVSCNPGGGTVNCVRWSEFDLTLTTPSLVQAGVYADSGAHRVFPDLAVNQCDDMAVGYTKSNSSMFPSVWYTGRQSGDPAGMLQAEAQLKAGETAYTSFDSAPYRWGDYTAMTIDPDGSTFWYLGEYSKSISAVAKWGTYIGSFSYPSCGAVYGVDLSGNQSQTGSPGMVVTYTVNISNTGSVTDIYDLSIDNNNWNTVLSVSSVELNAGTSGKVDVYVTVDADAMAGATDMVWVSAVSQGDTGITGTVHLRTMADAVYGVALAAQESSLSGLPGVVVSYTVSVTNTGNVTDTFALDASGNMWDTAVPVTRTIAAHTMESFIVNVTVPMTATVGMTDTVTITAESMTLPTANSTIDLTTTATGYILYLPVVIKP